MEEFEPREITDAARALEFVTAGDARITLKSKLSGTRFSYRVSECENKKGLFFVSLLMGSDNETSYQYMGIITDVLKEFKRTAKSRISEGAPSFMAFDFFWRWLNEKKAIHANLEVWHEGRCGRCGRTLTVPESIASGFGPECAGRMGVVVPFAGKRRKKEKAA